jgi:rod shape-determining protein MreB
LREALLQCDLGGTIAVAEPLAAAIGAGLDISLPYAQMVIDIGDGVTDVAVIRSGDLVLTKAVRKACGDLRSAVQRMIAKQNNVFLDEQQTELLLQETSVITDAPTHQTLAVQGVDRHGVKRRIELNSREIAVVLGPLVDEMILTIAEAIESVPPGVAVEIMESGICVTGGGARLPGLPELIRAKTSIDVKIPADPLHSTINGLSQILMMSAAAGLWRSGAS